MTGTRCPKCNGTGSVLSHLNPHDPNRIGAGMGRHRCDRCAGQGVIHTGVGLGAAGGSAGGSLADQFGNLVIWIFGLFFAAVFADVKIFGLNWIVSGFIGLLIGAMLAGILLAHRIGRYVLWAIGIGFVGLVIAAGVFDW